MVKAKEEYVQYIAILNAESGVLIYLVIRSDDEPLRWPLLYSCRLLKPQSMRGK